MTSAGVDIAGGVAGGGTLASGALQGMALAGGGKLNAVMSPAAAVNTKLIVMTRENPTIVHLS